jgi:hypothetical protein
MNMDDDKLTHIKECKVSSNKAQVIPLQNPLQPMPQCSLPNQSIYLDPFKMSDIGNKYVLTITDAFTKYAKNFENPNKPAETVADLVFTKWMCRYDYPSIIHSDGEKNFLAK